jgi:hypothetical protein
MKRSSCKKNARSPDALMKNRSSSRRVLVPKLLFYWGCMTAAMF